MKSGRFIERREKFLGGGEAEGVGGKKKKAGAREHGFGLLDWWRASHDGRNTYKYVYTCVYI